MKVPDIDRLVVEQLPHVLRRERLMAYVGVLSGSVGRLLTLSHRYAGDVRYRMAHNTQVCKLRSMLNDMLDIEQRRIEIADARRESEWIVLSRREKSTPVVLRLGEYKIVPARNYVASREMNFVVRVPAEWRDDEEVSSRLRSIVNGNKLASMRYRVEYTQ